MTWDMSERKKYTYTHIYIYTYLHSIEVSEKKIIIETT